MNMTKNTFISFDCQSWDLPLLHSNRSVPCQILPGSNLYVFYFQQAGFNLSLYSVNDDISKLFKFKFVPNYRGFLQSNFHVSVNIIIYLKLRSYLIQAI